LKEGDACTKFFHLKANKRRRRNYIAYIKDSSGHCVWDHKAKEQALNSYFENIIGNVEHIYATLNWESLDMPNLGANHLDAPFCEEEIKKAIDELHAEKAPGPDGFTGTFYKTC
jgi:predicted ATPase